MKNFRVFFCDKDANVTRLEVRAIDAKECANSVRRIFKMGNPKENLLWSVFSASRSIMECLGEFGEFVFSKTGKEISQKGV